jgi:hypothetical protein
MWKNIVVDLPFGKRRRFMAPTQLHEKAYSISHDLKEKHLELFEVLLEIETQQIYLGFEVTSLRLYCIEMLQMSPHVATDFVTVIRRAIEVPAVAEAIRSKKTTVYKLRKVCAVITNANSKDWIDLASECSTRIVERAVAMARPRESVVESVKYISGDVLEFKLAVSEEWDALLKRTKDLMSQKQSRAISSEEALHKLMENYCAKEDPIAKAERWERRSRNVEKVGRGLKSKSGLNESGKVGCRNLDRNVARDRTRYREARIEHAVNLRDRGQCTHVGKDGRRCETRRWLRKHHIVEFAEGGDHSAENLTTLCGAHHRLRHTYVT